MAAEEDSHGDTADSQSRSDWRWGDQTGDGGERHGRGLAAMGKRGDALRKMAGGGHGSSREGVEGELQEGAGAVGAGGWGERVHQVEDARGGSSLAEL